MVRVGLIKETMASATYVSTARHHMNDTKLEEDFKDFEGGDLPLFLFLYLYTYMYVHVQIFDGHPPSLLAIDINILYFL